jgi:hypothetical protein
VVDDGRSRPTSDLNELTASPAVGSANAAPQTAGFTVGSIQLELTAAPGAARLIVAASGSRDIYVVDPNALSAWATEITRLLSLVPANHPSQRADYRAPFLIDREGRQSVTFEALVGDHSVGFRLLVTGAAGRVAGLMTTPELVREIAGAAAGAVMVASAAHP